MSPVRRGLLSDLFEGVVAKRLTLVETVTTKSNQHEFQGTKPFRALFGDATRRGIPTRFIRFGDDGETSNDDGFISWSNVREGKPRAPEYHCYYSGNAVTNAMQIGETLFLALQRDGKALAIITPPESTTESQLVWLFGLTDQSVSGIEFRNIAVEQPRELNLSARYILDELGIELEDQDAAFDSLIDRFGVEFPTTRVFSELARTSLQKEVDARDNPDAVLMAWLEREEILFRRLERRVVAERLKAGFISHGGDANVEDFIAFSLSVQNRRKARAGQSLELHLEALFHANGIRFARGAETENKNKPDFLFPGASEYRDEAFPAARLTMLGAKSTLKDRWRQVLSEAKRITHKHLVTLEPGISEAQTNQMQAENLQLVVPVKIHETFRAGQRAWLMKVTDFVELAKARQD